MKKKHTPCRTEEGLWLKADNFSSWWNCWSVLWSNYINEFKKIRKLQNEFPLISLLTRHLGAESLSSIIPLNDALPGS